MNIYCIYIYIHINPGTETLRVLRKTDSLFVHYRVLLGYRDVEGVEGLANRPPHPYTHTHTRTHTHLCLNHDTNVTDNT